MAAPALFTLLLAIFAAVSNSFVDATVLTMVNGGGITLCIKYWVPNDKIGGGCRELAPSQVWNIEATSNWQASSMWAFRGDCHIHEPCNTGPPSGVTQFEFTIGGYGGFDYYDISTLVGFNMGISVQPTNTNCPSQNCVTLDHCEGALPENPNSTQTCPYGTTNYTITFYSF
ncbi:hypothetical protein GOP47_0019856 [Adiantum capillus-veneris]|uniref:Uncharacterized protein n=1 Tax=Adiantum capillus-veneris TaxID=13818 RepID=A0A9D4UDH6_ADICA|nr:hypothetical protein GOP47_0019856 [Adiantum capillus-veneris]